MTQPVPGPATQTIDACFEAKLLLCKEWDSALGLAETNIWSAVRILRACYEIRRPFFAMADEMIWRN